VSEDFLRRWSRLKRQSNVPQQSKPEEAAAPQLPPVDSLTFESDFKAFMHSKVEEGVKRAALKKLFHDPRFNVMDGLDTYIDDYTKAEPISEELLARLTHAARAVVVPKDEVPQPEQLEEKQGDSGKDDDRTQDA
jgi:hypothetical protein